jgi:hypothetical protein
MRMAALDRIRTNVVGSLLRPGALAQARLRCERGEAAEAEFRTAENAAVDGAIRLQEQIGHARCLLEYDSPCAGGFEPLRFVPKGKTIVLGLSVPRFRSSRRSTI